jgi:hypothetical protein
MNPLRAGRAALGNVASRVNRPVVVSTSWAIGLRLAL